MNILQQTVQAIRYFEVCNVHSPCNATKIVMANAHAIDERGLATHGQAQQRKVNQDSRFLTYCMKELLLDRMSVRLLLDARSAHHMSSMVPSSTNCRIGR